MTLLNLTQNLTKVLPDDLHRQIGKSHAGMAHFAGTGPTRAQCWQCRFWRDAALAARPGVTKATLKPATCARFQQLTNKLGQKVPHNAAACKYFESLKS